VGRMRAGSNQDLCARISSMSVCPACWVCGVQKEISQGRMQVLDAVIVNLEKWEGMPRHGRGRCIPVYVHDLARD
jgi:hypothetical protein